MRQFDCPQCGAPVPFDAPGAVFAVCGSCQSMVVRKDVDVEAIGKMAELPPDNTPLQVGAHGRCGDRSFRLAGRMRVGWDDGFWNEWYADFGEGRHGWVAESQGFFLISEETPVPEGFGKAIPKMKAGEGYVIGKDRFTVTDVKKARVVAGEGELPFVAVPGEEWRTVDLSGPGRTFAGAEIHEEGARFFMGVSAQPEEITWEGLRAVPGWNGEPVPVEKKNTDSLGCPACGGVIEVRAAGMTMTLTCGHCGTLLDAEGKKAVVAQKIEAAASQLFVPKLSLGTRGTLRGVEWEVLGALQQQDEWSRWNEILLYNPWHGFAWLTEWENHWNYVRRVLETPVPSNNKVDWNGRRHALFARAEATVVGVTGEFYWRVRVGEKAWAADYIAPPSVISAETYEGLEEVTWSAGEYIQAAEVGKAFGLTNLPPGQGAFLNQPNPWVEKWPSLKKMALITLLVVIVIQILSLRGAARRVVIEEDLVFNRAATAAAASTGAPLVEGTSAPPAPGPLITKSFDLTGAQSPARLEATAGVSNSWLGLDAELVNEKTGETFPADLTVEYYFGYDDGSWSEGSQKAGVDIPGVPAGRYHLAITPEADPSITSMPFHVTLKRGGLFWSNFLICLLAISVWPLWGMFRKRSFEAKRWSESDYTP